MALRGGVCLLSMFGAFGQVQTKANNGPEYTFLVVGIYNGAHFGSCCTDRYGGQKSGK